MTKWISYSRPHKGVIERPLLSRTSLFVLIAHLAFILFSFFLTPQKTPCLAIKSMRIQTVRLQPAQKRINAPVHETNSITTTAAMKPQAIPKESPTSKPTTKKKNEISKKQKPAHTNASDDLIELEQTIAKIGQKADKQTTSCNFNLPTPLESLQCETLNSKTTDYETLLTCYLQAWLTLPERGIVKVSLTIDRLGVIKKMEILQCTSKRNAEYIKTNLDHLQLPPPTDGARNAQFILTLKGE